MIRTCPVCRLGKIIRQTCRTCGAPSCISEWRSWGIAQRAKAIEDADLPWGTTHETITEGAAEIEDAQLNMQQRQALDELFGKKS